MTSATKYVPPRRPCALREILFTIEHSQVIRPASASARVWHNVVYVVTFWVVALAATLVSSNHLASLGAGNVARAARPHSYSDNDFGQQGSKRNPHGIGRELLDDQQSQNKRTERDGSPSQAHSYRFTPAVERKQYRAAEKASKQIQQNLAGVLIGSHNPAFPGEGSALYVYSQSSANGTKVVSA